MGKVNLRQFLAVVSLLFFATWAHAQIVQGTTLSPYTLAPGSTETYTDSGGAGGDYSNDELSTLDICAPAGEIVTVTFTAFDVEASSFSSCFDNLTIDGVEYSGDDNDAGAGLACTDATDAAGNPTLGPFTSPTGGCITFTFSSDFSVTHAGWEATVTSAPAPVATQCDPPINGVVSNIMGTTADFAFESVNTPVDDHCWNFYIGNEGFDCDQNEEFIRATICNIAGNQTSDNPLVDNIQVNNATGAVSFSVAGLQPGTFYEWALFETCDGMPVNNVFNCSDALFGPFQTLDDPYTVTAENIVSPTCPMVSPGYVPNGSFDITIGDSPTCVGTYNITVTPVANSAPDGTTPPDVTPLGVPNYTGQAAGTVSFTDAGAGSYTVTVSETSACNPANDPETITVVVPDGTDADDPIAYLYDEFYLNLVADTDAGTVVDADYDAGTHNLPEGACNFQENYYVFATDACDGFITDLTAVTTSETTTPSSINPGTQATVIPDGFGNYRVAIDWSVGTSTVTISVADAAGNTAVMTVTRTVVDNVDATIVMTPINELIPVCATTRTITYGFTIVDGCDDEISDADVVVTITDGTATYAYSDGNGYFEYTVTFDGPVTDGLIAVSYTDDFGNGFYADALVNVQNAAEDMPPSIFAADDNMSLAHCNDTDQFCYSFQIADDCQDVDPNAVTFDSDGTGLVITYVDASNPRLVFFEACGDISAGTYIFDISYGGQLVQPLITINQEDNQPASVILPGNLSWTIPSCDTELPTRIAIQVCDDCDQTLTPPTVTLGGNPLTLDYSTLNGNCGYFEYLVTLTDANDGNLLVASYTDADGANTTVDALISVASHPDTWAPIIIYPSQDINVELDPCEPSVALVFFEVTVTDNCGVDSATLFAPTSEGVILLPSPGGPTIAGFFAPGAHQIVIQATDLAGNVRFEDFFVVVTQDPAVPANLACLPGLNVTLNDGCEAEVIPSMVLSGEFGCLTPDDFNITVIDGDTSNGGIVDGCGTFPYVVELNGSLPTEGFTGDFAPANWMTVQDPPTSASDTDWSTVEFTTTTLTLSTLGAGPFDGSDFDIDGVDAVAAVSMPGEGTLSFDYDYNGYDAGWDWFIIDLDGNVIANDNIAASGSVSEPVTEGMVLMIAIDDDGLTPIGPDLPSVVTIDNFSFAPVDVLGGDPGDFTTCWGELTAEDKTAPTIVCPDDTDQATVTRQVQNISGELTDSDPTLQLANYSCFTDFFNPQAGDHHYDTYTFTVSETDIYTFEVLANFGTDANMALYAGSFDPANPCANIIAHNEDAVLASLFFAQPLFSPVYRIALPLQAGETYVLLTSTWGNDDTGTYTWSVASDGNGRINGLAVNNVTVSADLICTDIDNVLLTSPETYATDADGNTLAGTMSNRLRDVLNATGRPTIHDNCGNVKVTVWDETVESGDCASVQIIRHFEIEDKYESACTGVPMTDECTQVITVRKPTLGDAYFPPLVTTIECDEAYSTDANGHPSGAITGYPFIQTAFGVYDINQSYCNLSATYSDTDPIQYCADGYKLVREWTLLDWCNPSPVTRFSQSILIGDFTPPTVTCVEEDTDWDGIPDTPRWSVGAYDCTASFVAPMPDVTDNCSDGVEVLTEVVGTVQVPIYDQWGINIIGYSEEEVVIATIGPNDNRFLSGIEKGCYFFRYTATDACGNTAQVKCPFIIDDQVAPTASCDDQLNVSINGGGGARIYASDVDEGSNDNCSDVKIEVRRSYPNGTWSPWGDYIDFDCSDVHNFVTIELRVWDDKNMDGIPGNTVSVSYCDGTTELVTDNNNKCWMEIQVEDKVPPICQAPHDVDYHCDDETAIHLVQLIHSYIDAGGSNNITMSDEDRAWMNEHFGEAMAFDNCTATAEQTGVINGLTDCGWGTVTRRFRATDGWGLTSSNTCRQVISIYEVHDYEICFPKDASANCGTPNPDTITTTINGCDLFAINVFDTRYEASGDECYKILRRYRVINWCEYDGQSEPVVIGRDEDNDTYVGEAVKVVVTTDWNGNNPIFNAGVYGNEYHHIDECGDATRFQRSVTSVGHWEYTQLIKVYDNILPVVTEDPDRDWDFCSYDNVNCTGDVSINFTVDENCTPDDLTLNGYIDLFNDGVSDGSATITGTYPDYTISGTYPLGSHTFSVSVSDGCGNEAWLIMGFEVVDCKAPSPICISGLAVELMPVITGGGMMQVWATDFIASDISDCSGIKGYSIHKEVDIANGTDVPAYPHPGITLTCDDEATTIVRIYAWDNAYNPYAVQPDGSIGGPNYDYCSTFVNVQDWNQACGSGSRVAGAIMTEEDEALEGASVSLTGTSTMDATTDNAGEFAFEDVPDGADITITPQHDVNPLNGVSTFDLVLISKHILGIQPLDTPYKMIAADVNNSGSISTIDIIQLRKLILGIYTEFPANTSWRFVDAAYTFPGGNPFAEDFPEVINFNNVTADQLNTDFVAVKIGDVNGSAAANLAGVEERTLNGVFAFNVAEQAVKAGTQVSVDFTAADIANVEGYQATLTFDNSVLSLNDIVPNVATDENFGTVFVDEGVITTSWNGEAKNNEVLFTLVFDVKADANLSDLLGVSSRYTKAEAYAAGNTTDVAINFTNGEVATTGFEVYQNTPNPFKGETVIGYNLPSDAAVTVTIQDVTGKTLSVLKAEGAKGYNTVTVSSKDLGASGVLYYTVSTDEFTATKKMVVVK